MAEYIEREALLNALGFENAKRAQVQPVSTFEIILSASAADVAPVRRGKWNDGVCSECGFEAMYHQDSNIQIYTKFCPYCGAKMDLEDKV